MVRACTALQGQALHYGPHVVNEAELIAYARALDPQPMHLDPASAQARQVGGLIGSGWQTAALNHAMLLGALFGPGEVVALLGVPRLKWAAPTRDGDVLHGKAIRTAHRASRSRPGHSILELATTLSNQHGVVVLEVVERLLVRAVLPGAEDPSLRPPSPEHPARGESTAGLAPAPLGPVQDMPPGLAIPAGSHTFEAGFARSFAQTYDPLPGLLEAETIRVSGWQSGARWLRQMVEMFHAREAAGEVLPQRGPGMGLDDLVWRTPVAAGDTLHYGSAVVSARPSASKPGWGILTLRNFAHNQHGALVLAFTCFWLWEARKPEQTP